MDVAGQLFSQLCRAECAADAGLAEPAHRAMALSATLLYTVMDLGGLPTVALGTVHMARTRIFRKLYRLGDALSAVHLALRSLISAPQSTGARLVLAALHECGSLYELCGLSRFAPSTSRLIQ